MSSPDNPQHFSTSITKREGDEYPKQIRLALRLSHLEIKVDGKGPHGYPGRPTETHATIQISQPSTISQIANAFRNAALSQTRTQIPYTLPENTVGLGLEGTQGYLIVDSIPSHAEKEEPSIRFSVTGPMWTTEGGKESFYSRAWANYSRIEAINISAGLSSWIQGAIGTPEVAQA